MPILQKKRFRPNHAGLYVPAGGGGGSGTQWDFGKKSGAITLSNANLTATGSGSAEGTSVLSTVGYQAGKHYFEITVTTGDAGAGNIGIGFANSTYTPGTGDYLGEGGARSLAFWSGNTTFGAANFGIGTYTTGDVIGVAVDFASTRMWMRKNGGLWNNNASADPANNTTGAITDAGGILLTGTACYAAIELEGAYALTANFGGTAYGTAAPSGFGDW
jgi:hypothetical protein